MNGKHRSSRLVATAGIFLFLILAFAGPVAAQEGVTYISEGQCIFEASDFDNCTAEDVRYGTFKVMEVIDGCTSTADTFTARIRAEVNATAAQRDDIAFWIGLTDYAATNPDAEPGDGALYGDSCYRQILSPTTTDPSAVDVNSGEGPYASLDSDNDFCGDIQQDVPTLANLPFDAGMVLTLPCADPDNDGVANLDACVSWENNRNVACADVTEALPGTPSKCDCGTFALPEVTIPEVKVWKIIVDKVTPQYPNSAEVFSFKLDGDTEDDFTPVEFTLTDGQTPFVSGALPEGTYSVVEAEPGSGWTLEKVVCVDDAGATYDPESIDLSGSEKTVTCTFTNTFEPPDSGVALPFWYLLIGGALLGAGLVALGAFMQHKARTLSA